MPHVVEINRIEELAEHRGVWASLLDRTAGATFFQSLEWLEVYWRHFGAGQRLRVLLIGGGGGQTLGIVPLVVGPEATRVGRLRFVTYPLHDWGSFYGPIAPAPAESLAAAMRYLRSAPRDWDALELRWLDEQGLAHSRQAMRAAGFQGYPTTWDRTAVVDFGSTWESYLAERPRAWRRNLRHAERELAKQGRIIHVRYRPRGMRCGDGDPRWALYDACERIARRSWQGTAADGNTLCHESVRPFLRDAHVAAAAAGAVDLNLLLLEGQPAAFVYNYCWDGQLYGLRLGFDSALSRAGVGTVLLARCIRDSFARGDRLWDLGAGSLQCKRHLQTRLLSIYRCSHYHPTALRAQILRARRWIEGRRHRGPSVFIAVGRVQDAAADTR